MRDERAKGYVSELVTSLMVEIAVLQTTLLLGRACVAAMMIQELLIQLVELIIFRCSLKSLVFNNVNQAHMYRFVAVLMVSHLTSILKTKSANVSSKLLLRSQFDERYQTIMINHFRLFHSSKTMEEGRIGRTAQRDEIRFGSEFEYVSFAICKRSSYNPKLQCITLDTKLMGI